MLEKLGKIKVGTLFLRGFMQDNALGYLVYKYTTLLGKLEISKIKFNFFPISTFFPMHMSYICLDDLVHARELQRSGGTHLPRFTQSV